MTVMTVQFTSSALNRQVSYSVLVPEGRGGPYPVLLQLHGYFGGHTDWIQNARLSRYIKEYPFLVVLPSGENSYYLNLHPAMRMEDFLMQDLYRHVSNTFNVRSGPWAIGGLSMGGYGAVRLGLKYPDRFASVWAHSGVFPTQGEMPIPVPDWPDADLYARTERLATGTRLPSIGFDCGTEDTFLPHNRRFHAHLERLGIAHSYAEHPGGHSWDYWDAHVSAALRQHAEALR